MKNSDREDIKVSLRSNQLSTYSELDRLLQNTLPTEEFRFYESSLSTWIDRIESGRNAELERFVKDYKDNPELPADWHAEEIAAAWSLSNDMYAALLVNISSRREAMYKNWITAWKTYAPDAKRPNSNTKDYKYIEEIIGSKLKEIQYFHYANAVRVMANCYKHSGGFYNKSDKNVGPPIDNSLAHKWGVEEGKPIDYTALPLFYIILKCGSFCEAVLAEIKHKLQLDSGDL